MQEQCSAFEDGMIIQVALRAGDNIHGVGEDIKPKRPVLKAGTKIDPRHVAVLSAMGQAKVTVIRKLRIGIFTTGSELMESGTLLRFGQIYDSNKAM